MKKAAMNTKPYSERVKVKRVPTRGQYDRETIYRIVDQAFMCHVGFSRGEHVSVIPMVYWRKDNHLYLHGSTASGLMRLLASGVEACISITVLDGLVFSRSAFHHSANYRSVVLYAVGQPVSDAAEKVELFEHFFQVLSPGRWEALREPNAKELKATAVLAFDLSEASAKIRTGGPVDDEADYQLPVWAGVVPLALSSGEVISDGRLAPGTVVPRNLEAYRLLGVTALVQPERGPLEREAVVV